jgi:hypothetical protein
MKYVASLSTIPSRIEHLHFTLDSLQNQSRPFDKIYLCIPPECKRLGKPYILPDSLMSRKGIEILRCSDYGPATKVLGLLAAKLPEITPDTKIFFCDDDRVYEPTRADDFWKASEEYPESVICTASTPYWKFFVDGQVYDYNSEKDFPAGRHKIRDGYMDIFEGFGGVIVKPRFFDSSVFNIPAEFKVVDDIWLSGCIKKTGRKIWGLNLTVPTTHKGDSVDPLWALKGDQDRKVCNPKCIQHMRKAFRIWNNVESLSLDNNIVIPTTPNVQRLHGLMYPILEHLKMPTLPPISLQKPETYIAELTEDVDSFTNTSNTLEKLTSDLVPICERFGTMLNDYKTATRFFVDHKLDIPPTLEAPLEKFLSESNLKSKLNEYISLHQDVRGWILRATLFKRRLFCHVCQQHIYHFVSTPCGHLSCDECKATVCKVCGKQTTGVHSVAF